MDAAHISGAYIKDGTGPCNQEHADSLTNDKQDKVGNELWVFFLMQKKKKKENFNTNLHQKEYIQNGLASHTFLKQKSVNFNECL